MVTMRKKCGRSFATNCRSEMLQAMVRAAHAGLENSGDRIGEAWNIARPSGDGA